MPTRPRNIGIALVVAAAVITALAAGLDVVKDLGGSIWSYVFIALVGIASFVAAIFIIQKWPGLHSDSDYDKDERIAPACERERIVVQGGESVPITLEVEAGDRIVGTIEGEYRDEAFDFGIYDAEGTAKFERGESPPWAFGGRSQSAFHVNWTVPHDDRWSVIISNRGRSKRRFVEVKLDRIRG